MLLLARSPVSFRAPVARSRAVASLLCAVIGLATAGARAGEKPEVALDRGVQLYEEGELGRAEPLLRAAAADLQDPKARARAFLYLGLLQASRKDLNATRDSLRAALSDDPLVALARDRVAPDIVAMFDGLRAEVTGELSIAGAGAGARISVDGRAALAQGPPMRLAIGLHSLQVVSGDGLSIFTAKSVLVHARIPARLTVAYVARTGKARLPPAWLGASWTSSRGQKGVVRGELTLFAGPQRLDVGLPGHSLASALVVVAPDGVIEVGLGVPAPLRSWYARRRPWGYVSLAVAGAAGIAGILLGKFAKDDADELLRLRNAGMLRFDQYQALQRSADHGALAANVFFGVAGAAAITGLVLVLTDPKSEAPRTSWRIVPMPLGASLAVSF